MGLAIAIPSERPAKLSETKYFTQYNLANSSNLKKFEPQYPLYSDEATKRRWIYLPEGQQINTQNLDAWIYPQGTILWKEFSIDGLKIETRVLEKFGAGTGPSAWRASVYLWRSNQLDADLLDPSITDFYSTTSLPNNYMSEKELYSAYEVRGRYKIAHNADCMTCHQGSADVSIGFSYLQLSSNRAVNIQTLRDEKRFSHPPMVYDELPGTLAQKAGLGYVQGNCAHCHMGRVGVPHVFRHTSNNNNYSNEPLVMDTNNSVGLVVVGAPDSSRLYNRFRGLSTPLGGTSNRMPQLGSAIVDPVGQALLNDWIMRFNE